MQFLEKDLEDIIFTYHKEMFKRGLTVCRHDLVYRQVPLGSYGICDLIGIDIYGGCKSRAIDIFIYELKKDKIDYSTLGQAMRYRAALEQILKKINLKNTHLSIHLALIGKTIETNGDFSFLLGRMKGIFAYTYKYKFDGIHFSDEYGYVQTNPTLPRISKDFINEILHTSYAKNQNSETGTLE